MTSPIYDESPGREASLGLAVRPTLAARLREVSGLDAGRLAMLLGVSRVTYQNWIARGLPCGPHAEQAPRVLALIEEAAGRLGNPRATREWLLTPVSAQGKRPIDYLQERRYEIVRGFVLRLPTGRERIPGLVPASRVPRTVPRRDREDVLDMMRPRLWQEDDRSATDAAANEGVPTLGSGER